MAIYNLEVEKSKLIKKLPGAQGQTKTMKLDLEMTVTFNLPTFVTRKVVQSRLNFFF